MTIPEVRITGDVCIPRELLSDAEIADDTRSLSCPNPAKVSALKAGSRFAFRLPDSVSSLVVTTTSVIYPAGAASVYRARLQGKEYSLVDERPTFEPSPLPYLGELTVYQARALEELVAHANGIAVGPCGSGKLEIAPALIGRLGVPALFIVSSLDQAAEARTRISARLGVAVGIIGGGEVTVGRFTVALVQSLDAPMLARISGRFGVVIVDECHHAAAESYRTVLNAIPARRRYGFTATPDREDGLRAFLHHYLGPVRAEITRADLVAAGRAVDPEFREVTTAFEHVYRDRDDWAGLLDALAEDGPRNALIADTVVSEGADATSLVLTGRVVHAHALCDLLLARGLRAAALTGQTKKSERLTIIAKARAGALDAVCATQIFDEGLDVPRLARLFLTFPAKGEARLVQRAGRVLRVDGQKPHPVIFDFVDRRVGVLAGQARKRRAIFARQFPTLIRRRPVEHSAGSASR